MILIRSVVRLSLRYSLKIGTKIPSRKMCQLLVRFLYTKSAQQLALLCERILVSNFRLYFTTERIRTGITVYISNIIMPDLIISNFIRYAYLRQSINKPMALKMNMNQWLDDQW